jgi:tetratricopeptide (TPR) repeat protein
MTMNTLSKWWKNQKARNLLHRGTALALRGEYPAAIAELSQAVEIDPRLLEARLHRGIAYIDGGEPARALPDLDSVIRDDPDCMLAHYNRSIAHHFLGNLDPALEDANRAVELAPRDPAGYNHRAILHSRRGEYGAAIADASMEIELGSEVDGYNNRAVIHEKKGDYAAAADDWTEVIRRDRRNAKAFCLRGLMREKSGRREDAVLDLQKGLKHKDDLHPDIRAKAEEALRRLSTGS